MILARAIQKTDLCNISTFLDVLGNDVNHLQTEDDLVDMVSAIPVKKAGVVSGLPGPSKLIPADIDTLVNLLLKCHRDMLTTSAVPLVRVELNQVDRAMAVG